MRQPCQEFHNWVNDQGKRVQDPNSRATADFVIEDGAYALSFIELYDVADLNFTTVVATFDKGTSIYSDLVANQSFNVYRAFDYDWVYSSTDPNELLYHHYRVIYNLTENCFNMVDDDGDNLVDCDDTPLCDCTSGSADFPNELFKWNPPYQSQAEVHYDFFYDQLQGLGLSISPSMTGSLPSLALGEDLDLLTRKPIQWTGSIGQSGQDEPTDSPDSYRERTDWMFHYAGAVWQ